jgi:hypothetical protein
MVETAVMVQSSIKGVCGNVWRGIYNVWVERQAAFGRQYGRLE